VVFILTAEQSAKLEVKLLGGDPVDSRIDSADDCPVPNEAKQDPGAVKKKQIGG